MRGLFDHNVPSQLRRSLLGHEVRTAKEMGWAELENGELLDAAQTSGFDVMVTGDKRLSREQNLEGRTLALPFSAQQTADCSNVIQILSWQP